MPRTTTKTTRRTRAAAAAQRTPVRVQRAVVENPVVSAFLAWLTYAFLVADSFDIGLTEKQEDALTMLLLASVPLVAWVRSQVRPLAKERRQQDAS